MVEEKSRIGGNREAFSSLETLGCVQRSLGCSHGDVSTEFGDEKTWFSPSAASAGRFPRMVRDIQVVARPLAPLGASPLDAPGSIILEDLESVSTTFFCCSCMDYSFRLLFAFVSMCHESISTSTVFSAGLQEQSVQEELTPFPSSPTAFRLLSHTLTPIFTPRWQPRALREYTKLRYTYACKSRDLDQSSWLGLPLPGPCAVRFIHWVACMVLFFANHGTPSFYSVF